MAGSTGFSKVVKQCGSVARVMQGIGERGFNISLDCDSVKQIYATLEVSIELVTSDIGV